MPTSDSHNLDIIRGRWFCLAFLILLALTYFWLGWHFLIAFPLSVIIGAVVGDIAAHEAAHQQLMVKLAKQKQNQTQKSDQPKS